MFIRIVSAYRYENAWLADGIFTKLAYFLKDRKNRLSNKDIVKIQKLFEWFNDNLEVPSTRYQKSPKNVCWFRESKYHIFEEKIADMVSILKKHKIPTRIIRAKYPGKILYRDKVQIIAKTPIHHYR